MESLLKVEDVSQRGYVLLGQNFFEPEITALATTVHSGNMSFRHGNQTQASNNRFLLFKNLGWSDDKLAIINPEHSDKISWVSMALLNNSPISISADVLITREVNVKLGLASADCLPVFFNDPSCGTIALAHAGRRGLELDILHKTLTELICSGGDMTRLKIILGPGIHSCCYSFDAAYFQKYLAPMGWEKFSKKIRNEDGKITSYNVDLYAQAFQQIARFFQENGLSLQINNIQKCYQCTSCQGIFFSHRKIIANSQPEQRFLSLIVKTS